MYLALQAVNGSFTESMIGIDIEFNIFLDAFENHEISNNNHAWESTLIA